MGGGEMTTIPINWLDPEDTTTGVYWRVSKDGDRIGWNLYRRHYSAKNPNPKIKQFVGPGQKMVLIEHTGRAVFAWRKYISDAGEVGVNCAVFRNESVNRSSEMIEEAVAFAWHRWPGERLYTYVNPVKVRSTNPGYCFKVAGWRRSGETSSGLIVLELLP